MCTNANMPHRRTALSEGRRPGANKHQSEMQQEKGTVLQQMISAVLQKSLEITSEEGTPARLTTAPIKEHGFGAHVHIEPWTMNLIRI